MLPFDKLQDLRDELAESLVQWGKEGDGFYRSSPSAHSSPSFTNTALVLQALHESGRIHIAQGLADRLILSLNKDYNGLFPHEKAPLPTTGQHVICNATAAFSMLDVFPSRVDEVRSICDWLIESQRQDGSWSLFPGESTTEPIVTGYALSALQQYHRCCLSQQLLGRAVPLDPEFLERKITLAVDFLLERARPAALKREGLFLWPASILSRDAPNIPLSLGTSAFCLHVLDRWMRYKNNEDVVHGVSRTFQALIAGLYDGNGQEVTIERHRLQVWDQLHFNDFPQFHYQWSFFAPICTVTLLRLADRPEFESNPQLLGVIARYSEWINNHVYVTATGRRGVSGGETLSDPKVWSTAHSVTVLSRLLKGRHLFTSNDTSPSLVAGYLPVDDVGEIYELVGRYSQAPPRYLQFVLRLGLVGAVIAIALWLSPKIFSPKRWPSIEGYVTVVQILVTFSVIALGISLRRLVNGLVKSVVNVVRAPKYMREVVRTLGRIQRKSGS